MKLRKYTRVGVYYIWLTNNEFWYCCFYARKPKSSSLNAGDGIQASYDTVESLQKRLHGGRKTIKSKHKKPKRDKDKSEDHMYSDLRSRSSKYTQKDEDKDCVCEIRLKKRGLVGLLKKIAYKRSNQVGLIRNRHFYYHNLHVYIYMLLVQAIYIRYYT